MMAGVSDTLAHGAAFRRRDSPESGRGVIEVVQPVPKRGRIPLQPPEQVVRTTQPLLFGRWEGAQELTRLTGQQDFGGLVLQGWSFPRSPFPAE
jgi:hypothetical protein